MTATEEIRERTHDENAAPDAAPPPSLPQKILDAAKAVGVIEKDGENRFHHYSYSSIEAIVAATRDELLSRGVLLLAGEEETSDRQRETREGEATVTTVRLTFRFLDAETGESLSIPWVGRGEDPADKGVAKALTDARKTFLIQQLNLVRGDDTEADEKTDQRGYGQMPNTVNLTGLITGSGLSDEMLNKILTAAELPTQAKPYGAFGRIPSAIADNVRQNLMAARRAMTPAP